MRLQSSFEIWIYIWSEFRSVFHFVQSIRTTLFTTRKWWWSFCAIFVNNFNGTHSYIRPTYAFSSRCALFSVSLSCLRHKRILFSVGMWCEFDLDTFILLPFFITIICCFYFHFRQPVFAFNTICCFAIHFHTLTQLFGIRNYFAKQLLLVIKIWTHTRTFKHPPLTYEDREQAVFVASYCMEMTFVDCTVHTNSNQLVSVLCFFFGRTSKPNRTDPTQFVIATAIAMPELICLMVRWYLVFA